jgi:hypothetical protein
MEFSLFVIDAIEEILDIGDLRERRRKIFE